ncbi:hypothetical protein EIP91_010162 [Steccherinum ochraceum]|uniref:Uncharacterized protein n=1 Tax=Steccherinum ochraceum TaxID=92696 RepID=A0A4R0RU07_9APHY|nr:hypothetical protein EIP91_010162 [Steccherinum ochraceum]
MPDHWKCKFAYPRPIAIIMELGFTGLCLLSFGSSDLDELWSIMARAEQDKELFTAYKDRVSSRVSVITIVAGLILSTTAAFATTDPPRPRLLDYTQTGAYLCILSSLGIIVGGVIVGSISIFVMTQCTARWCMRTLLSTPMLYGIAINLAAMHAESALPKLGAAVFFIAPFSVAFAFAWTQGLLVVRGAWMSGLRAIGRKARDDRRDGPVVPSVALAGRISMPTPEVLRGDSELGLIESSLQRR